MKHNRSLQAFAARLREFISAPASGAAFEELALELFSLQYEHNAAYRALCEAREASPETLSHWAQIPAVPTLAFKELVLSCLPPGARTHLFHSSGTTTQRPSRHFHCAESLEIYQASLLPWFEAHLLGLERCPFLILTPTSSQAPHSSLVHMFETVRREFGSPESLFLGDTASDGGWTLNFSAAQQAIAAASSAAQPVIVLGSAFTFVHLLDYLAGEDLRFPLPAGSRVLETGGYKGRSRTLPKGQLHSLITQWLGVPQSHIVCEYGMSELSSQAYDRIAGTPVSPSPFHFPPWARTRIISPETGEETAEGDPGLLQVFDLANVFSVLAIQTEDLAIRRGDCFELLGRAALAENRGCSLMAT
jgi:hypothetical protein